MIFDFEYLNIECSLEEMKFTIFYDYDDII